MAPSLIGTERIRRCLAGALPAPSGLEAAPPKVGALSAVAAPCGSMGRCPEGTAGALPDGAVCTVVGCCCCGCGCAAPGESGRGAGTGSSGPCDGSACGLPGTGVAVGCCACGAGVGAVFGFVAGWACCAMAAGTPVSKKANNSVSDVRARVLDLVSTGNLQLHLYLRGPV